MIKLTLPLIVVLPIIPPVALKLVFVVKLINGICLNTLNFAILNAF